MIKRTTARTLALLLALLSVFLFLSGCAKKPEPIMYDDEFQDFAQGPKSAKTFCTVRMDKLTGSIEATRPIDRAIVFSRC